MKVDSTSSSGLSTLKDAAQRTQQGGDAAPASASTGATAAAGSAAGSASGDASVSLSGLAAHLHSLAASGSADIDTANIESIRQGIKDGTLKIDTGKIADGVLETARNLLQQKSPSTGN
ncbi:MAG: flagellar biosynthesis anti-sigma factor FlgM [Paraburkholderia sp.]|uniref:flagellar biosynthesis anti-sigma factor FlgM n=1 Tax=Paraburkholderia sp. TaxID=1926495 RepID=UPI0011F461EF|nr:flagellar biosynthesis anti-sigma factor FlgM [Paraburkholderia sp.]TAL96116.1 MAG: flagellar biosynthesis anti-sigma factor FlgM [Paraburkholderia sp.]